MSTQLPAVSATTAALQARLAGNKVQTTSAAGGKQFLRFDAKHTGEWLVGRDAEPCTGDAIAVDVGSLKHGWILWHNRVANRRLVDISQELPTPQDPIVYRNRKGEEVVDEPSEARYFEGNFEDGVRVVFEGSTVGARSAVDDFLGPLFKRAMDGNPFLFPQIELATDSYDHPEWGKVYKPVFRILAWYDESGNEEPPEAPALENAASPRRARAAGPTPEPSTTVRKPPAAAPEAEVESDEAPAEAEPPRRRRRAG